MTSGRKILSNRRNANRSTGPKTQSGKERAARNSRKHGLSTVQPLAWSETEIKALARSIAGGVVDGALLAQTRRILAAQALLRRATRRRIEITESFLLAAGDVDEKAATEAIAALRALERYERSALAGRRFAIRDLLTALGQGDDALFPKRSQCLEEKQ